MGPDFAFEDRFAGTVCGIDEAGRGPLAGPVIAAAVILPRPLPALLAENLNDSKKIGAKNREILFAAIRECAQVGIGSASVEEIDRVNILQATFLAMRRALEQVPASHALVDGNQNPKLPLPLTCIVKGDALSYSIAAASIIAKVFRDRLMADLARQFPAYGWERNAGYGTAAHMSALRENGVTMHHRRSFAPVSALLT